MDLKPWPPAHKTNPIPIEAGAGLFAFRVKSLRGNTRTHLPGN